MMDYFFDGSGIEFEHDSGWMEALLLCDKHEGIYCAIVGWLVVLAAFLLLEDDRVNLPWLYSGPTGSIFYSLESSAFSSSRKLNILGLRQLPPRLRATGIANQRLDLNQFGDRRLNLGTDKRIENITILGHSHKCIQRSGVCSYFQYALDRSSSRCKTRGRFPAEKSEAVFRPWRLLCCPWQTDPCFWKWLAATT